MSRLVSVPPDIAQLKASKVPVELLYLLIDARNFRSPYGLHVHQSRIFRNIKFHCHILQSHEETEYIILFLKKYPFYLEAKYDFTQKKVATIHQKHEA